jgi:hypothetical protein
VVQPVSEFGADVVELAAESLSLVEEIDQLVGVEEIFEMEVGIVGELSGVFDGEAIVMDDDISEGDGYDLAGATNALDPLLNVVDFILEPGVILCQTADLRRLLVFTHSLIVKQSPPGFPQWRRQFPQ